MSWGLVAVAGATLVGGAVASNSAKKSARTQADAAKQAAALEAESADKALSLQEKQYEQAREDSAPYTGIAKNAAYTFADELGLGGERPEGWVKSAGFEETPEYQNAIQAGEAAIGRQSPVFASGQRLKALLNFNQNLAGQFRNDRLNRLTQLIGVGTGTTGQLASLGQGFANSSGNLIAGAGAAGARGINAAGSAEATGILGTGKAVAGGIGSIGNALGGYLNSNAGSTNNAPSAAYTTPASNSSVPYKAENNGIGSSAWNSLLTNQ